jgi:hypothetical protein
MILLLSSLSELFKNFDRLRRSCPVRLAEVTTVRPGERQILPTAA